MSPTKRKREEDTSLSPSAKKARAEIVVKTEPSSLSYSLNVNDIEQHPSPPTASEESRDDQTSTSPEPSGTDATSVDEDTIVVEQSQLISPTLSRLKNSKAEKKSLLEQATPAESISTGVSISSVLQDDTDSNLSELPSEMFSDMDNLPATPNSSTKLKHSKTDDEPVVVKLDNQETSKRKKRRSIPELRTDVEFAPLIRTPGDYVLTDRLIAEPTAAWIICQVCDDPFVQLNAYFTHFACPRCERHSKLYGYEWPKTDREGSDDEDRVLDHRTVHRFISSNEEREARKAGRSESRAATREVTEVEEKVDIEKRRSKRRSSNKRTTM
jgi:histone-lysine N-methyltransferase SUV420H